MKFLPYCRNKLKSEQGFSLLEMLIVITISSLLTAIFLQLIIKLYQDNDFFIFHNSWQLDAYLAVDFITEQIKNSQKIDLINERELAIYSYYNQKYQWLKFSIYQSDQKIKLGRAIGSTEINNRDFGKNLSLLEGIKDINFAMIRPGLLKDTIKANQDTVKDGDIKTGMITVFGTSGDMEGGTADYADMHKNPYIYGFLPFQNIWDEDAEDTESGYFHPIDLNLPGYYDSQGNSDRQTARKAELDARKNLLDRGATSSDIQGRMQERPLGPREAFGNVSFNNFPTLEIQKQFDICLNKGLHKSQGQPVKMWYSSKEKRVKAEPILDGSDNTIYRYKPDNLSLGGCPVIYEQPIKDPPRNSYKIGYDPYRQDQGTSLSSIIVYKPVIKGERTKNIIVAEYVGRPQEADDVTYIAKLFSEYYNTQIMFENEVTHVRDYFKNRKELHYLAEQPDTVIQKSTKKSKVSRVYGCHMNTSMKDAGEKYIKSWLLSTIDYDEHGNKIRALDKIYSVGLLEELLKYDRKGNFDRVMALMQVMFQDKEEEYGTKHQKEDNANKKLERLRNIEKKSIPANRRYIM